MGLTNFWSLIVLAHPFVHLFVGFIIPNVDLAGKKVTEEKL